MAAGMCELYFEDVKRNNELIKQVSDELQKPERNLESIVGWAKQLQENTALMGPKYKTPGYLAAVYNYLSLAMIYHKLHNSEKCLYFYNCAVSAYSTAIKLEKKSQAEIDQISNGGGMKVCFSFFEKGVDSWKKLADFRKACIAKLPEIKVEEKDSVVVDQESLFADVAKMFTIAKG